MKFNLVDKIESLTDDRIVAVKYVSLAEEYLADHFPTFPVLPGVMMLEAATQSATWLMHRRTNFAKTIYGLKRSPEREIWQFRCLARGTFLRVDVEFNKPTDAGATFKVNATVADKQAFAARIELAYFNLADKQPDLAHLDARLAEHNRYRWSLIAPQHSTSALQLTH